LQKKIQEKAKIKVTILVNSVHLQPYGSTPCCSAFAIAFVEAFYKQPNFFQDLLATSRIESKSLKEGSFLVDASVFLKEINLKNARDLHDLHIKELIFLVAKEAKIV
jgi:hypothetical protein